MLRRNPCTRIGLLAIGCAVTGTGLAAGPANAFESARYQGPVEVSNHGAKRVCTVDGCGWGQAKSDGTKYRLDLRVAPPNAVGENAGATVYKTPDKVTVCRGTLRAYDFTVDEAPFGAIFTMEVRRTRPVAGVSSEARKAIIRARTWCHRKRSFKLMAFFGTSLGKPAPRAVKVQFSEAPDAGRFKLTRTASENRAGARAMQGPAFPGARRCPGQVAMENLIGFDVRVRNAACSTAKQAVRKARFRVDPDRMTIKGWRCRSVGSYYDGGYYRCNRHRTTIQFGAGV